jgi:hypothetical protein
MSLSSGFSKKRVRNLAFPIGVLEVRQRIAFFGRFAAISVGIWPAVDAVALSRAVISTALWKGSADAPFLFVGANVDPKDIQLCLCLDSS